MAGSTHPFRFGVQAFGGSGPSGPTTGATWSELARRCEGHGYDILTMPDHFGDQLAPVPALAFAAASTSTLRIGALVFDNDYRHPSVLAKELATLDVLSGGRLEIGLGAGWEKVDYDMSGIAYDAPGVRVDRFVEGLKVITGLMGDEPVTHGGTHYTVTEMAGWPKPVQRPHPPLLIGGGGKRVLGIAGRWAQTIGINGNLAAGAIGPDALSSMTGERVDEKIAWAIDGAVAAGRDPADLEWNVRAFFVSVLPESAGAAETEEAAAGIGAFIGFDAEQVLASPFALIGPPSRVAEVLLERRERWGFSYVVVGPNDVDPFAPVVAELAGR
jgi:probable F420-dependent oxidoreductase